MNKPSNPDKFDGNGDAMSRALRFVAVAAVVVGVLVLVPLAQRRAAGDDRQPSWAAYKMSELIVERRKSGHDYHGFLRVPAMSAGLYVLAAGAEDPQKPHRRDEVYYVTEGLARFEVDGEDMRVLPGMVLYVKAGVPHRFHTIVEDLKVLVVFSG